MDFGITPKYRDASLNQVHDKQAVEIKELANKIIKTTKKKFYEDHFNIYLFGQYRVGKSWLIHAIANHVINVFKEKSIYVIDSPKLNSYFVNKTFNSLEQTSWINFLSSRRVLIIDALGQEHRSGSGFTESNFESFLRWRDKHNKITIIESNATLQTLEDVYGESFANFIHSEYVLYEIPKGVDMGNVVMREKLLSKNVKHAKQVK